MVISTLFWIFNLRAFDVGNRSVCGVRGSAAPALHIVNTIAAGSAGKEF